MTEERASQLQSPAGQRLSTPKSFSKSPLMEHELDDLSKSIDVEDAFLTGVETLDFS